MAPPQPPSLSFLLLLIIIAAAAAAPAVAGVNPFTARAATIRYWNRRVSNNLPHPTFLLAKLSPLSAADAASFASAAASGGPLPASFCSAATILCPSASSSAATPSLSSSSPASNGFSSYSNRNFSGYGTGAAGGSDSFATYSPDDNLPVDSFRRYGRDATGRNDSFQNYQADGNVVTSKFSSYGGGATGGGGAFANYAPDVNVPDLGFANYDASGNGVARSFGSYSTSANAGDQSFSGYGKAANSDTESFASYGNETNVVGNSFANYGENGNGATDGFAFYGHDGNVPENNFRSYGSRGNAGSDHFSSYRDEANVGDDTFRSYAKDANGGTADFENYGKSFNQGSDTFKGYGEGSNPNHQITFKGYFGNNLTFKGYAKSGVTFSDYHNSSSSSSGAAAGNEQQLTAVPANRWSPEPGKFFREAELVKGNVMPMPDIRDRMPPRSFLPWPIATAIPFTPAAVSGFFGIDADTAMGKAVADTVSECRRTPSRGETKRCVATAEDMIDFAVEVLGSNIIARSTASAAGSSGNIAIGDVTGIDGGNVTHSVSCHQSLFPYLVYYCHSVPKVRVYEADILDANSREKINHGVAICHLDTSDWSPGHGAFVALGSQPGEIEVCHWIFQGDMTWTVAN